MSAKCIIFFFADTVQFMPSHNRSQVEEFLLYLMSMFILINTKTKYLKKYANIKGFIL